MSGLVAFVQARIDEEAADIEAEIEAELARLATEDIHSTRDQLLDPNPPVYDPPLLRRVRQVEAMRQILTDVWGGPDHADMWDHHVRLLAAIDRVHPDYDPAWTP